MHLHTIVTASLFVAAAASPLAARQGWTVPSNRSGVETLQDEHGQRTSSVFAHALERQPTPQSSLVANWQVLGPFGGDIEDVQVSPTNPNLVLAGLAPSGGNGGMYRSTDGGTNWSTVATLDSRAVYDIAFAPDGTAYAGTIDGVWKSTDNGATFIATNLGIGLDDQVYEVDVDPSDPMRLWCGVADALGGQPVNVMLSTNGGTTWTNRTPPLASPTSCSTIAIDPANSMHVVAGFRGFTGGGQVWGTTNGGTSWTNRSAGLPGTPVNDLEIRGANLYVAGGQLFGSQNFGFFFSPNDGVTWNPLHDGTWTNLVSQDIAIDPGDANTILVATAGNGIHRTTNGGASWTTGAGGTGSLSVNAVSFAPTSPSTIFTGSASNAVWKSTNSGAGFAPSSTGIGALDVYSIAANPLNGDELAIAFQGQNNGGVITSLDGGASWSLAALPGTRYSHVRFSPTGTLYAISSGPTTIGAEGLYRRTGSSWASIGPDQGTLFESDLTSLRVSANNPNFIVAVGADFGVAGFEPTVWRTTNGGGMWTKVYEGPSANHPLQDVVIVDAAADTTWAAAYVDTTGAGNGGVLRSTNSAVTWAPSNSGLPTQVNPVSIAGTTLGGGALYVSNSWSATGDGVFKSVDGGQTWSATGFIGSVQEVQTDGVDPNVLYIAQYGAVRVRSSGDGGATFAPFDTGLISTDFPRDMQRATGAGSDLLYAGSKGTYTTDVPHAADAFCFGDGSGTACPCAPPSGPGTGCLNSFGTGGLLYASGANSVSSDAVTLTAVGLPTNASTLFFQGTALQNGGLGSVFGDGLRCAAGTVIRLGTKTASGGVVSYPAMGDQSVSLRGMVPGAGGLRYYQGWYRNAAAFCTVSTFNLTNGLSVSWAP
jgi:hypothetical protein